MYKQGLTHSETVFAEPPSPSDFLDPQLGGGGGREGADERPVPYQGEEL